MLPRAGARERRRRAPQRYEARAALQRCQRCHMFERYAQLLRLLYASDEAATRLRVL